MEPPVLNAISRISDHLYISGYEPVIRHNIQALGITLIVDAANMPKRDVGGVEYVKVAVVDSERASLCPHFDAVADAIQRHREAGGKALVHCAAGISRSCALCMAYLVKHEGMTLKEAYIAVKSARNIVNPNNGFWRQLINYENCLRGSNTVTMMRGHSRELPDVLFAHLLGRT